MTTKRLDRRTFLRASGIAMGLPLMESMLPGSLRAEATNQPDVRRMLAICAPLGMHTPLLFPDKTGTDYEATPYLEPLQSLRNKFTIMSGLMHPDVDGGHSAEKSFLTGAAHPGQPSFKNTISVDQYAAERMGHLTRVPSLTLSANHTGLSYTRSGVQIPSETRPSKLFGKLFLEGNAEEKAAQMRRIEDGQSIMDLVRDQTRGVSRKLGREDNETLDQYLTSVRELEERLVMQEKWAKLPKPKVDQKAPDDIEDRGDFVGRMALMYDLIFLAFRTDSTRLVTFCGAGGNYVPTLAGVDEDWHNLSHHGKDAKKIEQLAKIELEEMKLFAKFMERLEDVKEGGHSLLDQTAIFSGSNLGNASSHNNTNLPVIAAGGRFKHGQHLSFDPEKAPPLCNLFVSYFQHLGIEVDRFSSGTGTLSGI
ncbi:DUF1552 domain-containing protein [Akkermansiaceae bacterium]|jgi:hypothetical protein|nr:DUF1552 domain-containing protein [Akkermansiaceae bacterium]MDB4404231.1 DUF1552 domain-containing protein [Akkermansiaceae bacterium]|tara:strand:+ start:2622 stop:3887 length:1266 start_codon:yes stop_codon:yes gene_type:complete